jgi:hypothetical protein
MTELGPTLPETRVVGFTLIRRERRLPARGEVSVTTGNRLDPLDTLARAMPPRARRAISLTRVLGVREEDVPKRLLKQVGDSLEPREIIIAKPINFGFQQLVYRAPGAGQIVAIEGSWMLFDLDGMPVDLHALYRGTVASIMPRLGAVIEAQGALIQGAWGSGREGYGVLRMMTKSTDERLEAQPLGMDTRGTILVAGAGVTEEALRRADELQAQGLIVGGLAPQLRALAEQVTLPIIVTEGFGRVAMSAPIFELLNSFNGQEAAVNAVMRTRGGALRPEIFIPLVSGRFNDRGTPQELTPLQVEPGARVRIVHEPYLGRIGTLPQELSIHWTQTEAGTRIPSAAVELRDANGTGTETAIIPWTNLELIG